MKKRVGPYTLTKRRLVYKTPWIELREDRVIRRDGGRMLFGVVRMREGASVLALDERRYVYLAEEYKYAVRRKTFELISGGLNVKETPLAGAKRELREETGLIASHWTGLGCVHPFTTVVESPNHIFLARRLRATKSRPDPGEQLRIIRVPFQHALNMVLNGKIIHAASCVAILKTARILGK